MSVASFSVKRPVTISMIFLALFAFGFMSLGKIGQELFPDIALPTIVIYTVSPGVGPYDIESTITKPIEGAVTSLSGVTGMDSSSSESLSYLTVRFAQGTEMDKAATDIREKLNQVEDNFPDGTQSSRIFIFTAGMMPTLRMNLYTETTGLDLRRLVKDKVIPELERIPGVAQASIFGGKDSAVLVELDLDRLKNQGLSMSQVMQAFKGENVTLPGGVMRLKNSNVSIRTVGTYSTLEDVGSTVVGARGTALVLLRDVADVSMGTLPQEEFVYAGAKDGLRLNIQKRPGFNTIGVNEAVKEKLRELKPQLPPTLHLEIQEDQGVQVENLIGGVAESAWEGAILAILVLIFFLRNFRSTIIVATTIPLCVVATFALIAYGGMTLNISSMMGITLAIGMLVDDAIVVVESIYRKLLQGMSPREAAVKGTDEVASAVISSTLTTLAVFVPLLMVEGLAGVLFKDLALTICFSIAMSLFAAMTLVPMLCSRLMKAKDPAELAHLTPEEIESLSLADLEVVTPWKLVNRMSRGIQKILKGMDDGYGKIINWALDHVRIVLVSAVVLLVASVGMIFLMGMEFIPETDDGQFSVNFETRIGATYEYTSDKARQVEDIIREVAGPWILTMSSRVGDGGSNYSSTNVTLKKKEARSLSIWQITRKVDDLISQRVMDVNQEVKVEGMAALATMSTGIAAPLVIHLKGDNIDAMYDYAKKIKEAAASVNGTRNLQISHKTGKPELQLKIKHDEAVSLGLSPLEIAASIRAAYSGFTVSRFSQNETDYDVRLVLRDSDRNDLDKVRSLYFINPRGKMIPLENVVDISESSGPVSISRKDRARIIDVTGSLTGTVPLSQVSAEVEQKVKALGEPPFGVELEFTGSGSEMNSSFTSLFIALMAAVFLVYMVMASQFENLVNPLIIMFSVPFAIIGLVLALLLTNTTFNIMSFTGAILLVGVVVKNAIILIDYIQHLRVHGMPLRRAITFGGMTRLKPILMTSLCTVLGLIPMALGLGDGAELRSPMARAVIGGLTTSTLITLIIIPTMLWVIETRFRKKPVEPVVPVVPLGPPEA